MRKPRVAFDWYEEQATGLGEQFLDAVDQVIEAIRSMPQRFPRVHKEAGLAIRRALLERFPYGLYFIWDETKPTRLPEILPRCGGNQLLRNTLQQTLSVVFRTGGGCDDGYCLRWRSRQLHCGFHATVCLREDERSPEGQSVKWRSRLHQDFQAASEVAYRLATDGFLREIRARTHLQHPGILPIRDWGARGTSNSEPFIILPFCANGDLRSLLRTRDFVPVHEAIAMLYQIASALDYAHSQGVVHGDIKPENILIGDNGRDVFLADFGVSRFFSFDESISTTLLKISGAGTTAYLSPEQIAEGNQSHRSDVYSFAMVVYELLTGRLPFDRSLPPFRQMQAKVAGQITDPTVANPRLTENVRKTLVSALHHDSVRRPGSATEFCDMLAGKIPPLARRQGLGSRWAALEIPSRVAIVTALIAALAGIVAAGIEMIPELLKLMASRTPR